MVCDNTFWGVCGVMVCCYGTIFLIIVLISTGQIFDIDFAVKDYYSDIAIYMLAILMLMLWGFIQYACLYENYQQYQLNLERQDAAIEQDRNRRAGILDSEMHQLALPTLSTERTGCEKCVYYSNIIGNAILGLAFVGIEVILVDEMLSHVNAGNWEILTGELFSSLFLLLIMLYIIPLTASTIRIEDKYILTISLIGFIPIAIIGALYDIVFAGNGTIGDLFKMLMIFIPIFAMYTTTLNYVRRESDNIYRAYLSVSGFGFMIPATYTFTMYWIDYFEFQSTVVIASIIIFAVCTTITLVFFVVYAIMRIREIYIGTTLFKEMEFLNSGHLINSSGGILAVGLLVYVYTQVKDATEVKRSTVFGLIFLIMFLTICINILLGIKIPKGITSHHFDKYFLVKTHPKFIFNEC